MIDKTRDDDGSARWAVPRRWLVAIGFALVPVIFTAVASAAAQLTGASDTDSALIIAGGAALSAALGVAVMLMSPPRLAEYGFRAPRRTAAAWWFAPLPVTVLVAFATQGVQVPWQSAAAYAALAIAVAVNEEVWFRGIVLAVLRTASARSAVIGTSILFGVLHLANLAGGADPAAAALQLVFAVLFGVVAAELVVATGSLWPAMLWHAAWDAVNFVGGNSSSVPSLIGIAIACAVMLVYAIRLFPPSAAERA